MRFNWLQLNLDKTKFMWCTTGLRLHRLPITALMISLTSAIPGLSVRDLGMYIDSDLVMHTHVCRTIKFFRCSPKLLSIQRLVSTSVFQYLVTALVFCRLDYGNGTLISLPAHLVRRLQSVHSAAARPASVFAAPTTFLTHSLGFIGYVCQSGSSSRLPS